MSNKKGKGLNQRGHQNVLKMMGYDEAVDDDDDDMEQQLAALLGQDTTVKKKPKTELLDWSIINAQVESSMKEVGNDSDDSVTEEDENEFMSELTDIVEEDFPSQLSPKEDIACRSPSPRSVEPSDVLSLLQKRTTMYKSAIDNAQKAGQSSKIRRLQRGVKTLNDLVKQVNKGKTIRDEDIPPEVSGSSSSFSQQQSDSSLPLPDVKPIEENRQSIDSQTLQLLNDRKQEYKQAAIQAKHDGDKQTALQHFKVLKQIEAIEEGRADLSKIPPTLHQMPNVGKIDNKLEKIKVQPNPSNVKQEEYQQATGGFTAPEKPLTIVQALEQRLQKYQVSEAEAHKDGNGGKARRMGRIVKQYQTAIKSHKAGRSVNFIELPVPPGYPPLPGIKSEQLNLNEKIGAILNDKDDALPPETSSEMTSQLLDFTSSNSKSPSERKSGSHSPVAKPISTPKPPNHYEQQVSFLENRQAAFKRAALSAKRKGDKTAAVNFLRKMKGFDSLIEAAKNGLKVDISKVPQPPLETTPIAGNLGGDEEQNILLKETKSSNIEEDKALYTRLLKSLHSQVNIARSFAQQMTLGGDLSGADSCDRLAVMSQTDYDYVRSCRRHGDAPPHFHYEEKTFNTTKLIPDIENNEMELVILQCMDLNLGGKDVKLFVEWEFPFPHDNPLKGKTEEISGLHVIRFDERFRVPFNRKLKSSHRAVKSKSLKLEVFYKSGILRRTTSVGTASIKLMLLEKKCELLSAEEIKDGRQTTGKIEVCVRLRTPLNGSESIIASEKWLYVKHSKPARSLPSSSNSVIPASNLATPQSSAGVSKTVSISSLDVLQFDLKMNERKIAKNKQRGAATTNLEQISRSLKIKFQETKTFLEGGQHAKKEYSNCLRSQYEHLTNEAQMCKKQGKMEQMKLALAKKTVLRKELDKYK